MKGRWGAWDRGKREISLSRNLVARHSWDAVREVLLHETAHQLADEGLGGCNEKPHGPVFRKACLMLRANPSASGCFPPLDERFSEEEGAGEENRILRRLKKLMALAESPNRYEADAAMVRAHALAARYNLDCIDEESPRSFVSVFLGKPALRHRRNAYALALLLQDFYFVHGIWVPAYVLDRGKMGRVLEVSGTLENVRMASYVYDFVSNFIEVRWRAYNRTRGMNHHRKTDFSIGVIKGFRGKMELCNIHNERASSAGSALVNIRDAQLERYIVHRYPRTATRYSRVSSEDARVRGHGEAVGREMVIHKGIHARRKRGRLLAGKEKET